LKSEGFQLGEEKTGRIISSMGKRNGSRPMKGLLCMEGDRGRSGDVKKERGRQKSVSIPPMEGDRSIHAKGRVNEFGRSQEGDGLRVSSG